MNSIISFDLISSKFQANTFSKNMQRWEMMKDVYNFFSWKIECFYLSAKQILNNFLFHFGSWFILFFTCFYHFGYLDKFNTLLRAYNFKIYRIELIILKHGKIQMFLLIHFRWFTFGSIWKLKWLFGRESGFWERHITSPFSLEIFSFLESSRSLSNFLWNWISFGCFWWGY